jgi:hypothetical protein
LGKNKKALNSAAVLVQDNKGQDLNVHNAFELLTTAAETFNQDVSDVLSIWKITACL